jgi:hypothetical protein
MKSMKLIPIIAFILGGFIQVAKAQEEDTKLSTKQFYIEIGGPGIGFSANLDGRFDAHKKTGMGYRIGLGFSSYKDNSDYSYGGESSTKTLLTIPLGVNYILGKENSPHTFEVGAGATILSKAVYIGNNDRGKDAPILGHVEFMYRRVPLDGGFTWRIGFTPLFSLEGEIILSVAVGMGYSF